METIYSSPFFGFTLTLIMFSLGRIISRKIKLPFLNEMIIASILTISVLLIFDIPYDEFIRSVAPLQFMIIPATIALAYGVYEQLIYVKKFLIPIIVGSIVGSIVSIGTIYVLARLFEMPQMLTSSLVPKSVTTAIAIELSTLLGGMPSVTILAVIFTGFTGVILGPLLIKTAKIKDPVVIGLSYGISSHVIGTAKAFEYGKVEGAMSGIAIFFTGIATVIVALLIF